MRIFRYISLDSTNLEAIRFAGSPAFPAALSRDQDTLQGGVPFVFSADSQTAGRGQRGHVWVAPWGGLYVSLLYPVTDPPSHPCFGSINERQIPVNNPLRSGQISLLSAWSVFRTIESILNQQGGNAEKLDIHWPNDLYFNRRKISGILTESACPGWLVTGIGININADLPESDNNIIAPGAPSPNNIVAQKSEYAPVGLKQILNKKVNRDQVFQVLLDNWQDSFFQALKNPQKLQENVQSRLAFVGQPVTITQPERPESASISGTFLGIDSFGFARLQTESEERRFSSGRIRLAIQSRKTPSK